MCTWCPVHENTTWGASLNLCNTMHASPAFIKGDGNSQPEGLNPRQPKPAFSCPTHPATGLCLRAEFIIDRNGQPVKRYKSAFDPAEFEGDIRLLLVGLAFWGLLEWRASMRECWKCWEEECRRRGGLGLWS